MRGMWVKHSEQAGEDADHGAVFIQKLLGHNNIKTTLRYLHVTNKDLVHILSPLADIESLLKR